MNIKIDYIIRIFICLFVVFLWSIAPSYAGDLSKVEGERYESIVPDTLDLAERSRLALNVLIKTPEPDRGYYGYQNYNYFSNPQYLAGPPGCMSKYLEAIPMMRIMCGSDLNYGMEMDMLNNIVNDTGGMPYVMYQARLINAMLNLYAYNNNPELLDKIAEIAKELRDIAIYRSDYAYYPLESNYDKEEGKWDFTTRDEGMFFVYHPPDEPAREQQGIEGHVKRETTDVIMALSRWYALSGEKESLELCEKLIKYVMKSDFWEPGKPPDLVGTEHGIFEGHFHGNVRALRGILEYAMLTNDKGLKQFVRDAYEYARNFGIARIGWFPSWLYPDSYGKARFQALNCEGCCVADMTMLAAKLSDAGVGDYWEDVDQYVRNQLAEQQVTDIDIVKSMAEGAPEHEDEPLMETDKDFLDRAMGAFMNFAGVTHSGNIGASCCTGNCTQALYSVWESIVRYNDRTAKINLLLNRVSPWLDIASYLPYEGKVVLNNKTSKNIVVRIPYWVDKKSVKSKVNGNETKTLWIDNYLFFGNVNPNDVVVIEFPMVESFEKYKGKTINDDAYECHFKGNTLVDISPREEMDNDGYSYYHGRGGEKVYPTYRRDFYKENKASMVEKTQFVSSVIIKWHL